MPLGAPLYSQAYEVEQGQVPLRLLIGLISPEIVTIGSSMCNKGWALLYNTVAVNASCETTGCCEHLRPLPPEHERNSRLTYQAAVAEWQTGFNIYDLVVLAYAQVSQCLQPSKHSI